MSAADDERRNRRLLFSGELAAGTVRESALVRREVRAVTIPRRVPSALSRAYQERLLRRGALRYEQATVAPLHGARRSVLGEAADGPPKLLLRVDAFPHPLAEEDPEHCGLEAFRRVRALLDDAGVAYLVPVPARVGSAGRPLDDAELAEIAELRRAGAAFALHGLDRRAHGRGERFAELDGRPPAEVAERLATAAAELAEHAIVPDVVVPPDGRLSMRAWPALAAAGAVVAGGPGSVRSMGYHDTPLHRGDAVWMPSYAPIAGDAGGVLAALRRIAGTRAAVWVPAVVDWGAEARDGLEALGELAREAARFTVGWDDFLEAVRAGR